MPRLTVHVLVHSVVLAAVSVAFQQGWITASDDPLGQGLTAFAVLVGVSALWGAADGWFLSTPAVVLVWVVTGVLVAVALPFTGQLGHGFDLRVALSDLASGTAFIAGLVAVPGACTGAVVSLVRPPRQTAAG
jgi:hypothetical protein